MSTNPDASPDLLDAIAGQVADDTQCGYSLALKVAERVMDIIANYEVPAKRDPFNLNVGAWHDRYGAKPQVPHFAADGTPKNEAAARESARPHVMNPEDDGCGCYACRGKRGEPIPERFRHLFVRGVGNGH